MRRSLAAFAVSLLLAACATARDDVTVVTLTIPHRPSTPEQWSPLPSSPSSPTEAPSPPISMPPATPLPAETTLPPAGGGDVFDAALAVVEHAYNWRSVLPGWTLERREPRGGLLALTYVQERRIEVYPRVAELLERQAYVIAHEIGHGLDLERVTPFERAIWASHRGFDPMTWFPTRGVSDFGSGAGDFAESFAYTVVPCEECWNSLLGPPPTADEQALLGALIR